MAVSISDIVATTIESRTKQVRDNVTDNSALLSKMKQSGNIRTFSGGTKIYEELSYAENPNGGWYNGYDLLPVGAHQGVTAAEFEIKQLAVPVVCSGLEMLQNAGKERMIDLLETRIKIAESTMMNLISTGLYSDGVTNTKSIVGLDAAVAQDPDANTEYGGINPSTNAFWENKLRDGGNGAGAAFSASNIQESLNTLYAQLTRNADRPNLVVFDDTLWGFYVASLQAQQRFTTPEVGKLGFPTLKFFDADVILDGGIGGALGTTGVGFMLNTNYLHYRPHAARNMVPLAPRQRHSTNQDAEVQILAWAGNMTCSGRQFQGRLEDVT